MKFINKMNFKIIKIIKIIYDKMQIINKTNFKIIKFRNQKTKNLYHNKMKNIKKIKLKRNLIT